ncbi:MAG: hypothetical protein ACT4PE_10095 [Candidatus Eiseniibacteriota bacterium]
MARFYGALMARRGRYGFLITVPDCDAIGFRGSDLATLGTLTGATLEVDSRTSVVAARAAAARRAWASQGEQGTSD